MKIRIRNLLLIVGALILTGCSAKKNTTVKSPDGKIEVVITTVAESGAGNPASISVNYLGRKVLLPSDIGLAFNGIVLPRHLRLSEPNRRQTIQSGQIPLGN